MGLKRQVEQKIQVRLFFTLPTYNSSALVGSEFGGTWEDLGGCFSKFALKRALKQDQIVHMEGKLQVILYFSRECWVYKHAYYHSLLK